MLCYNTLSVSWDKGASYYILYSWDWDWDVVACWLGLSMLRYGLPGRIQNIRDFSVWSRITSNIPGSSLCSGRFTKSLPFSYVTHSLALNLEPWAMLRQSPWRKKLSHKQKQKNTYAFFCCDLFRKKKSLKLSVWNCIACWIRKVGHYTFSNKYE